MPKKQFGCKARQDFLLIWTHKHAMHALRHIILIYLGKKKKKNPYLCPSLTTSTLSSFFYNILFNHVMCQGRNRSPTAIMKEFPAVCCTALKKEVVSWKKRTIISKYFNKEKWNWYFSSVILSLVSLSSDHAWEMALVSETTFVNKVKSQEKLNN